MNTMFIFLIEERLLAIPLKEVQGIVFNDHFVMLCYHTQT